jgi:hypothetical protein
MKRLAKGGSVLRLPLPRTVLHNHGIKFRSIGTGNLRGAAGVA